MKKIISLLICLVMSLMLCSCDMSNISNVITEKEVTHKAYSEVWDAYYDEDDDTGIVTHEVGSQTSEYTWGAVASIDDPGSLIRCQTAILYKTCYTAYVRLCVDDLSNKISTVCVLRILDKNKKEVSRRVVTSSEFSKELTYQDFSFTFDVQTQGKHYIEVYWPAQTYCRVGKVGIMSKTLESMPNYLTVGERMLNASLEENIQFDENSLYCFDLRSYIETVYTTEEQYDISNLVCTLQGLVNRNAQRLFVRFMASNAFSEDTDNYWLNYLRKDGRFLANKTIVNVSSPYTLLKLFSDYYTGFAAWDTAVPATVNAVATACGVEDLLPVRYSSSKESLYYYVKTQMSDKPIKIDLGDKFTGKGNIYETDIKSTGSRKNDVYIWALEKYLKTRKVNSHMMAYHVDAYGTNEVIGNYSMIQNMFLANRDYYIQNKCFFFDLSPMNYYTPDDDPDVVDIDPIDGTIDFDTFCKVMEEQKNYAKSVDNTTPIDVGGFTPWHLKYTKYTDPTAMGEVQCEWETVYQFSVYNAYINADAPGYTSMSNASILSQMPTKAKYTQTASKEKKENLPTSTQQGVNYVLFYCGDFDASAWLNTAMISMWNDSNRGEIPICWSFALDIAKRAPHVIDMMYSTATSNDYFVAGDNGVGYLNPQSFTNSRADSTYANLEVWGNYNKKQYEKYDIDYTGFLITKNGKLTDDELNCYKSFCGGLATNAGVYNDSIMPVARCFDYSDSILNYFEEKAVGSVSTFTQVRFILRTPTEMLNAYRTLTSAANSAYNIKLVDPYTFYKLMEEQGR